jgi:hypothetical protein
VTDHLTKLARGMICMIRLPGCLPGTETVVACHYRIAGACGIAMKPNSILCAWGCHHCHDCCDGRKKLRGWSRDTLRLAHAEGVFRTQLQLVEMGKLGLLTKGNTCRTDS